MTEPDPLQQFARTYVIFHGRKLSYFSGCDYFRLSSHPLVLRALHKGAAIHGITVAASRLTTGNHELYQKLEKTLADFFESETALVLSSGYSCGLTVTQALANHFSAAFIDERSHPALFDAARFLGCPIATFKHRSPESLRQRLAKYKGRAFNAPIVLTDGMFSHDGSAAPLKDYLRVLPTDGRILVDDAHGAGVLGATGKGTLEHAGVGRARIIQTISLSKAFGAYGGAVLCRHPLRRRILEQGHAFIGSTPIPLPLASACAAAIGILRKDQSVRKRLHRNSIYVKSRLRESGLSGPETPGPIVALPPLGRTETEAFSEALLKAGIFPSLIKYVSTPGNGYFRFVISSEHTREQLDSLLAVLLRKRWRQAVLKRL